MIGKYRYEGDSRVDATLHHRLAGWIDREMQLSRLHEEILANREALINCSMSYHQSQGARRKMGTLDRSEARERNHKLLRDIARTQMNLNQEFMSPPSPRFTTLQKNYWAMVKSQLPLWEQDLGFRREETPVQKHRARQQQDQGFRREETPVQKHRARQQQDQGFRREETSIKQHGAYQHQQQHTSRKKKKHKTKHQ